MVFPAFLPLISPSPTTNIETLTQLSRIGPLLIPLTSASLLPQLSTIPSVEIILDLSHSEGIDEGSIKSLVEEAKDAGIVVLAIVRDIESRKSATSTDGASDLGLGIPLWLTLSEERLEASTTVIKTSKAQGLIIRISEKPGGVLLRSKGGEEGFGFDPQSPIMNGIRKDLPVPGSIYLQLPPTDSSSISTTPRINPALIRQAHNGQAPLIIPSSEITDIPSSFTSILTSDRPDGLFPTIVIASPSPSPSSLPAGLVYSSIESISNSILTGKGTYQSRKHGLWVKGLTSGSTQLVKKLRVDCDSDALVVEVEQGGGGFCHLGTLGCFSPETLEGVNTRSNGTEERKGILGLEDTLQSRLKSGPEGSYTSRLFSDPLLLSQKLMEETDELLTAQTKSEISFEAADVIYFLMVRCVKAGVSWADVERSLDEKAEKGRKGIRRQGDAKQKWVDVLADKMGGVNGEGGGGVGGGVAGLVKEGVESVVAGATAVVVAASEAIHGPTTTSPSQAEKKDSTPDMPVPKSFPEASTSNSGSTESIRMRTATLSSCTKSEHAQLLRRPVMDSSAMIERVKPIVSKVRDGGDEALRGLTLQFDKCPLESNVLSPPFYDPKVGDAGLDEKVRLAIDQAYSNIKAFHQGQAEKEPLVVETMPGVVCTRFARPIDRVGLYVPGGTAILPSTALMLGVPAQVAGCKTIVMATPPRKDGSITPEVLYVAHLVGATVILKAGGAQAVAAMAYGTETCPKVDKIFGPGNQWVTAAKMLVQNDTEALVGIDMPAGPSEVMVIADNTANPVFVASDLLSQAEHGIDSQVVLVAIDLAPKLLAEIEDQVEKQALALPRVDIIKQAIKKSLVVKVNGLEKAMEFSNEYAPEHLILHLEDSSGAVRMVDNAGSVFVGAFSPESCGDYASGTNHTLPTYGYAKQFSGVNTLSFQKHITSQELTKDGLRKLGPVVVTLAECEGLEAHANAVRVRLAAL